MHLLDPDFQITPEVLQKIANNKNAAPQLSLDHFTDEEAQKLAHAIIDSTIINTLYLYFTERSDYSPALLRFLTELNPLKKPIGLNLQSVKLNNHCLDKIAELLANNKLHTLSINHCHTSLDNISSLLTNALKSTNLRELHTAKNNLGDTELAQISQLLHDNKSLQTLSLYKNNFTAKGIIIFADAVLNNTSLHTIDLSFNELKTAEAKHLLDKLISRSKHSPIRSLNLANTKLTDAATEVICALIEQTKIEKLDISGNFFSDTSLKKFHAAMSANVNLKEFKLSGNTFFPGHPFPHNPDMKKYPEQQRLLEEIKQKTEANKNNL